MNYEIGGPELSYSRPLLEVIDLGRKAFEPVVAIQERLVEERRGGRIADTLLLVEHESVYTLGRNAKEDNVLASPDDLRSRGIRVVRASRGGDVTYHGPGQLVGYPILHMGERDKGVLWYIGGLEQALILALADFGVAAGTDRRNRGVWVGNDKIAAIGVRVTRRITMHGFALNVCTDLSFYRAINPCGMTDAGVTSLAFVCPGIRMDAVKARVVERFRQVFEYGECRWSKHRSESPPG